MRFSRVIACSSTGNAASSLAGNAAAAGLETYIFVPSRAPKGKVAQLMGQTGDEPYSVQVLEALPHSGDGAAVAHGDGRLRPGVL